MRLTLVIVLLVTPPLLLAGAVYKNVQPDGTVVYSDQPAQGAEELKLPELQTYTPTPIRGGDDQDRAASAAADPAGFAGYQTVAVSSPEDDATLRDNAGTVSVSLTLEPALQVKHSVDIRMDGQSIGKGRGTSISLTNVDRGTHTLLAVVLDETGKEVGRSDTLTFHLNRASLPRKQLRAGP